MDNHTPEQRSRNMKAIHNKDSKIEVLLRKELWARGLRYQKNSKRFLDIQTSSLSGKRSLFFAIVSSGMCLANGEDENKRKGKFQALNYISYTATPYANVLNEANEDSLYPKGNVSDWSSKA